MSFTLKDVEEALEKAIEEGADYYELEDSNIDLGELGETVFVEDFGGEGMGDTAWIVFKVQDRLFRLNGYYSSYEGTEWDGGLEEVKEVEVLRKEYEVI